MGGASPARHNGAMFRQTLAALMLGLPLLAQEPPFFEEAKAPWWKPEWELRLVGDRVREDHLAAVGFTRADARLRLRWTFGWEWGRLVVGSRHAAGTDGNANNVFRYDQEPSNGSHFDTARLDFFKDTEHTSTELRLGLQESALLSQESLWDKDLVFTGATLRAGFRREESGLVELGVRGAGGRVRTLPSGDVDFAGVQAVARFETGPLGWTLHSGSWDVKWTADVHRLRPLPGDPVGMAEHLRFSVQGAGVQWQGPLPVELKAIRHRNRDTEDTGEEFQAWVGSRGRAWWPQAGFIYQRYDRTGTPYPVNGDEWWFISGAKGPRYLLALPLPAKWLVQASYLRHTLLTGQAAFARTQLTVTKRF